MAMNPIRNENAATLRDLGAEKDVGANVATDRTGKLLTVSPPSSTGTLTSVRNEDSAFADQDAVTVMGGIVESGTQSVTSGDVVALNVNKFGCAIADLDVGFQGNGTGGNSPIRAEDSAFGDTNAVMVAGAVNNKNAAAFSATQGDVVPPAVNDYGYGFENRGGSFQNILTATTTTVKSGAGVFHRLIINKAVATSTITIYDNTAGSGTKVGIITQPAAVVESQLSLEYGLRFSTGLTLVTSSTDDITVVWD